MRSSSQTSTVTSQVSPSHSSPLTDSGGYPVRSAMVSRAALGRSRAACRSPFPSLLVDSAICSFSPQGPHGNQTLERRVLGLGGLLLADLAGLARGLDLHQLGADGALVVEL